MATLYRVIARFGSNQGRIEWHGLECLYCGTDYVEARRVQWESQAEDKNSGPGSQVRETVLQKRKVTERQ